MSCLQDPEESIWFLNVPCSREVILQAKFVNLRSDEVTNLPRDESARSEPIS